MEELKNTWLIQKKTGCVGKVEYKRVWENSAIDGTALYVTLVLVTQLCTFIKTYGTMY